MREEALAALDGAMSAIDQRGNAAANFQYPENWMRLPTAAGKSKSISRKCKSIFDRCECIPSPLETMMQRRLP